MQSCAWSESFVCSRTCGSDERVDLLRAPVRRSPLPVEVAEQPFEPREQVVADHARDADDHARRRVPAASR